MSSIWSSPIPLGFPVENCIADSINANMHGEQGGVFCIQRLPTEPVGSCSVTFSGVNAGSEIHVYLPDGTEVAGTELCVENQTLVWSVYSVGSPNNTVQITIIKRGLRWQKFSYVSTVGASSIPIFPQPDLGYNNPA